jgi:iron(III) transport system permease protein
VTRTARSGRIAAAIAVATAILVAAPVISIIALALQPAPDVWQPLIEYVLPRSLLDTALLLAGVGALSLAIGTGAAWAISLHEFRGRQMLLRLVPLPLAIPTYLAAYVYVDLFEPLGLVHRTLALWLPLQDAVRVLPNLRSLPGAIIVIALVLFPTSIFQRARCSSSRAQSSPRPRRRSAPGAGPSSGASHCRWHGPRSPSAQHWCRWKR